MGKSQRIRLSEMRQVHQLVTDILSVGADPTRWRTLALEGLKSLVGGQVGLTMDMKISPGDVRMIEPIDVGWQSESTRRRFGEYVVSGEMALDPGTISWLAAHRRSRWVAATRREMIADKTWYGSSCVSEARKSGDVDDFVCSSVALDAGTTHGFIIYRACSEKPFEARHRRIMRLLHLELARAVQNQLANDPDLQRLSPRLRQTLELLLLPMSLKEIAAQLQLSPHTVNDYQKAIYSRFAVNSRLELLHQFKNSRQRLRFPGDMGRN